MKMTEGRGEIGDRNDGQLPWRLLKFGRQAVGTETAGQTYSNYSNPNPATQTKKCQLRRTGLGCFLVSCLLEEFSKCGADAAVDDLLAVEPLREI